MIFYIERFHEIRKLKKITLKALADSLGRSYSAVRKWSSGERNPSPSDIRLIAMIMNISPVEISDLDDHISLPDKSGINNSMKIPKDIILEKHMNEVEHIIGDYGDIPTEKIKNLIYLENYARETNSKNKLLNRQLNELQLTINNISEQIYVKDKRFRYKFVNNYFVKSVGNYTHEEIINSTASDIFPLKEIKQVMKFEQDVFYNKKPVFNKKVFILGSKGKRIGLLNIIPIIDSNNNIQSIVSSIKDITEIEILLQRFEILDQTLNMIDHYIYIYTREPIKYEYRSAGIENITGRKREEFDNDVNLWCNIVHPEDRHILNAERLQIGLNILKYRILHKSGNYIWVRNRTYKLFNKKTNNFYYYGSVGDITHEMEQNELKELLKINSDIMPIAIYIQDIDSSSILYTNKASERITGYSECFLKGFKKDNTFHDKLMHPEDLKKYKRHFSSDKDFKIETRIITKDGKVKLVEINSKSIKFRDKNCKLSTLVVK
ncbi:MAG: PAS domain S-box protein [bacterium]|nr:PAS domain S-box protein [bacterium]